MAPAARSAPRTGRTARDRLVRSQGPSARLLTALRNASVQPGGGVSGCKRSYASETALVTLRAQVVGQGAETMLCYVNSAYPLYGCNLLKIYIIIFNY